MHARVSPLLNCILILAQTLVATLLPILPWDEARSETLISCPESAAGDFYDRGFYVPSYPGNSLDGVTLYLSGNVAGTYAVSLTVRQNTYNGAVLGTAARSVALDGTVGQELATVFSFPSIRVTKFSRICFILSRNSGPGSLYYAIPGFTGGCTEVVQTVDTSPPLSSFRRNGVRIVVTGEDTLLVAGGESIQDAIDAASPGDTVHVDPGVYVEDIHLRSEVHVVGSGFSSTILQGTGAGSVVTANNVVNARFEGFKILNSGTSSSHAGVYISGGNLLLNNNWITENINGIRIVSASSAIVRNNIVERNGLASAGFLTYGIISLRSKPLIANNLVITNADVGIYLGWPESSGTQVINNTVADNSSFGVWCYNTNTIVLRNNILARNSTGISASHGATPNNQWNNVWGNSWQNYDAQSGATLAPGLGDISVDPLFDPDSSLPYFLSEDSPCIDAGDPNPIYNDPDGSRNDMGAYGGPSGLLPGMAGPVTSGFLFNNIGKIPTSEITQTMPLAGLVNVSPAVANALKIYQYKDAPFGGNLWIHGLFGSSDTFVTHYKLSMAPWSGSSPPDTSDFTPVTDPLSKIQYTINPDGTVTAALVKVGPDENGLYLRTDDGYWAHPDLKLIWNTRGLADGRYDIICTGYFFFLGIPLPASLPTNQLSRITVWVNNRNVSVAINEVTDRFGNPIPECGIIPVASNTEDVQFNIAASHPDGFLRNYLLESLYGRNRYGGVIASDQYAGSNDGSRPDWPGVTGLVVHSAPAHALGTLDPWTTCAYQFRLRAWARTTDGFHHIYGRTFNDHYYVTLGMIIPTSCVADLDGDGDVDGEDLAIFAAQYGRTNCVKSSPAR